MPRLLSACAAALATLGATAAAAGAAPSLIYTDGGDVWAANPATGEQRQLTREGGLSQGSAADDGTILAVKTMTSPGGDDEKAWMRFRPDGSVIDRHLVDLGDCPSLDVGPLNARIDPSGTWVAFGTTCSGFAGAGLEPRVVVNPVGQFSTQAEPFVDSRFPAWFKGRLVVTDGSGSTLSHGISVQAPGANVPLADTFARWLEGSVDQAEIARDGATALLVGSEGEGVSSATLVRLGAGDPGLPVAGCNVPGSGGATRPALSPDGRWMAYADAVVGVTVRPMPELPPAGTEAVGECAMGATPPRPGSAASRDPVFTAYDFFAAPAGPLTPTVSGGATVRALTGRGLTLSATLTGAGRLTASATVPKKVARALRLPSRTVARGAARVGAPGTASVRVRATGRARRALRRAERLPLTVALRFVPESGPAVVGRTTVTLKR